MRGWPCVDAAGMGGWGRGPLADGEVVGTVAVVGGVCEELAEHWRDGDAAREEEDGALERVEAELRAERLEARHAERAAATQPKRDARLAHPKTRLTRRARGTERRTGQVEAKGRRWRMERTILGQTC
eukprot:5589100-Pleurochrysis_carterae.AAC.2